MFGLGYLSARVKTHMIYYAEDEDMMEELAQRIMEHIRKTKEYVLGFDTEMVDTRVSSHLCIIRNGLRFAPTVMIQLATSNMVAIFHFHVQLQRKRLCGEPLQLVLPDTLKQILRSDKVIKVGVATHNDTEGLCRTFGLSSVVQLVDLRAVGACCRLPFNSLKDVAAWCTSHVIDKDTPHDWCRSLEHGEVAYKELEYAALDAIVCWEAHAKLNKHIESLQPKQTEIATESTTKVESSVKTVGNLLEQLKIETPIKAEPLHKAGPVKVEPVNNSGPLSVTIKVAAT